MSRIRLLAAATLVGLVAAPAAAETRKLAADGTVHTIEIQPIGNGKLSSTALRHTQRGSCTPAVVLLVAGTEDLYPDRDPAIEIDPVSGQLVLVWSRHDGTSYNIFLSRFNGTSWSAPLAVYRAIGDDVEPQIRIGTRFIHVGWRRIVDGTSSFYRQSLLATTLAPAYGPEAVQTADLWEVPAEGGQAIVSSEPILEEQLFAGVTYPADPAEPGVCHIWGVRDEPVPIGYRECLSLPASARGATSVEVGWLGGRVTLSYVSGSKLFYATRKGGVWSPTRGIELTSGVSAADARWIVRDLNERAAAID